MLKRFFLFMLVLASCLSLAFSQPGVEKKAIRWSRGSSVNEYLSLHEAASFPDETVVLNAISYSSAS